jgi:hypothetical protein
MHFQLILKQHHIQRFLISVLKQYVALAYYDEKRTKKGSKGMDH